MLTDFYEAGRPILSRILGAPPRTADDALAGFWGRYSISVPGLNVSGVLTPENGERDEHIQIMGPEVGTKLQVINAKLKAQVLRIWH